MKSDTPLDYAVFQLSPKHSRCELFVSSDGNTQKLASGLLKPFVTHLKVAEEQVAQAVQSIKLEVEKCKNAETWFTKGTLERFVRFVSTPEVLELVNTFDAEMSQLEVAQTTYSQGVADQLSGAFSMFQHLSFGRGDETKATAAADVTKKELLKAIDVRLVAVRQDLTTACARASAAGFTPETVSELKHFADQFGAHRLNEACSKFISSSQRRPDLITTWKAGGDDPAVRSSSAEESVAVRCSGNHHPQHQHQQNQLQTSQEPDAIRQHLEQSKSSTCRQPKTSDTFPIRRSVRESSSERDHEEDKESDGAVEKEKEESVTVTVTVTESAQTSQPSRRLSVQDRINLFENKQKDQSGSGGKVVVGKSVELRKLPSDVSSAPQVVEKAVLRRWSGASEMSLDLNIERKETYSSASTPSSPSISQTQSIAFSSVSDNKHLKGLIDSATPSKAEFRGLPGRLDDPGLKDRAGDFLGREDERDLKDQAASQIRFRSFPGGAEPVGVKDQVASQTQFRGLLGRVEVAGRKDQAEPHTQFGASARRVDDVGSEDEPSQVSLTEFPNRVEDFGLRDQLDTQPQLSASLSSTEDFTSNLKDPFSQIQSKAFSGKLEGVTGSKNREASQSQYQWKSFPGKVKEDLVSSETQFGSFRTEVEDSGLQEMKLQRQISFPEQSKKLQGPKGESNPGYRNNEPVFPWKKVAERQEIFGLVSTAPVEQIQKVRQSKGNQELNDELQMKANELEKLFAAHKLRIPGDQAGTAWRTKRSDIQVEQVTKFQYRKPAEVSPVQLPDKDIVTEPFGSSNNVAEFDVIPLMKMVDNGDYGDTVKQNISELGFPEESKGKFYDRYMQKRDVKLREEWSSKREQKEAKMKAMQDSLESSRAELKSKFTGSADRQDSTLHARRRAEKLRSFNVRSAMKIREKPLESMQSDQDEDLSELPEETQFGQDTSFGETFLRDGSSRCATQSKKLLSNRTLSSSTPRTSAAPLPRSSIKASNSSFGRRRTPPEDPLAQSVPNFSDFRKENTKPSSGISKTTTRSQFRNYAQSKSISEELHLVKEDKPRRSQSTRKSSANPGESKDFSPCNSDGVTLTPLSFDKEQTEQTYNKIPKNGGSKPFLRKGNGIGPGAGVGIAKLKASMASENIKNEESEELANQLEDSVDMVKEEEEEEFEAVMAEEALKAVDSPADSDNEKTGRSQESEKSGDPGSEDGDVLRSFSQVDPDLVAEVASVAPSTFHTLHHAQGSPGESPALWNTRMHHSFSYTRETSDIDASVDSPIGSPASWNSHSLAQVETDAARMRKTWGSAQKPILVPNSSHTRKDVTKGFKRLLNFGRKNRGTESLIDWISATTSEGDDDTEDGRDPANRSSEDLRKSRMGFSQGHPAFDGFNDSEFSEQVQALHSSIPAPPENFKQREAHLSGSSLKAPRSFFSLSSFRSKGNESKPR